MQPDLVAHPSHLSRMGLRPSSFAPDTKCSGQGRVQPQGVEANLPIAWHPIVVLESSDSRTSARCEALPNAPRYLWRISATEQRVVSQYRPRQVSRPVTCSPLNHSFWDDQIIASPPLGGLQAVAHRRLTRTRRLAARSNHATAPGEPDARLWFDRKNIGQIDPTRAAQCSFGALDPRSTWRSIAPTIG